MTQQDVLIKLGTALYLHLKLAERAIDGREAAKKLAALGVFDRVKGRGPCSKK